MLKSDRIAGDAVLALLEHYGGPGGMRRSGAKRVAKWARDRKLRNPEGIIADLFRAIGEQTVTVAGTTAAETVIPSIARQLMELKRQRRETASRVERLLEGHPLLTVLTSMPGIAAKTGSQILLAIDADITRFESPARLAAYAGIAPVTRRSGTSIRGEHPRPGRQQTAEERVVAVRVHRRVPRPGVTRLLPAQTGRGQTTQRRHHLPRRRRCDVIYSMLKNGTLYQSRQHDMAKAA